MERQVVFEPREVRQGSPFHVTLHPQRLGHIHGLVGEAALVPRRLQGCFKGEKQEREINANSVTLTQRLLYTVFYQICIPPSADARLQHTE